MGLLVTQGLENPFGLMLSSIVYNFYPILAIAIVVIVIVSKKDIGPMAKAEKRTRETGKLLNDNSKPMLSSEVTSLAPKEGIKAKAYNMIIPLATMVFMMPITWCTQVGGVMLQMLYQHQTIYLKQLVKVLGLLLYYTLY